jgi:hypothetical protein
MSGKAAVNYGMVQMVLAANRVTVVVRGSLAALLLAAGVYWSFSRGDVLGWSMGIVISAGGCLTLPRLIRMLITGQAVVLTDRGVINKTSAINFVEWGEIRGAHIEDQLGITTVVLNLRNPDRVLARVPIVERALLRFSMKRYGLEPSLSAAFVEGGAEHLLSQIIRRIAERADREAV